MEVFASLTNTAAYVTTPTAAAIFRLNDTFAPYSGGHQPYGRDQLAAIYGIYKVLAVTVSIRMLTNPTAPTAMQLSFTVPTDTLTIHGLAVSTVGEKPNNTTLFAVPTNKPPTYVRRFPMEELLGVSLKDFQADDDNYASVAGSSPGSVPKMHIVTANMLDNTQYSIVCAVEVSMETEWWASTTLGQS
jgi:hypothetical protein